MAKETKVPAKPLVKVAKYEILKPERWVGGERDGENCTWPELARMLWDVQYIESRIGNLFVSEKYAEFSLMRTDSVAEFSTRKASAINRQIRQDLIADGNFSEEQLNRFSKAGALPSDVLDPFLQSVVRPTVSGKNWKDISSSNSSIPNYKKNVPVCIRCDKDYHKKIFVDDDGDHKLDLGITVGSKCRIILRTGRLDDSQKDILDKLVNPDSGWSQQTFQISYNERRNKWFLSVTYRYPPQDKKLDPDVIVGAELGFGCPIVAVANNDTHASIGPREFAPIMEQIRRLQAQTIARRNQMLRGGEDSYVKDTSRGGHGRKRRFKPVDRLQQKIDNAYKTLNHQMSRKLVDFAVEQQAGSIQMEDLSGIKDTLTGTFLGQRWRYYELQEFIKYKAKEVGIEVRLINPDYTSRRCYSCGFIHEEFTREYREENKPREGGIRLFDCPVCDAEEVDPDYNAASNLTLKDIERKIKAQCRTQGLQVKS